MGTVRATDLQWYSWWAGFARDVLDAELRSMARSGSGPVEVDPPRELVSDLPRTIVRSIEFKAGFAAGAVLATEFRKLPEDRRRGRRVILTLLKSLCTQADRSAELALWAGALVAFRHQTAKGEPEKRAQEHFGDTGVPPPSAARPAR